MTKVSGKYLMPDGTPALGRIQFTLIPQALDTNGVQRVTGPIIAYLDATGFFSVDLVPDSDLIVDGKASYSVIEQVKGLKRSSWTLLITDETSIDLPSAYPGIPVSEFPEETYDSGLIEIEPDPTFIETFPSCRVRARRIGNMVWVWARSGTEPPVLPTQWPFYLTICVLPIGFRPATLDNVMDTQSARGIVTHPETSLLTNASTYFFSALGQAYLMLAFPDQIFPIHADVLFITDDPEPLSA